MSVKFQLQISVDHVSVHGRQTRSIELWIRQVINSTKIKIHKEGKLLLKLKVLEKISDEFFFLHPFQFGLQ
jgi:hypothetical protein